MSWNLLIYSPEGTSLGEPAAVKTALENAFPGFEWRTFTEGGLIVDGGFTLDLAIEEGAVRDIYTNGGYNHIRQLAALCQRQHWAMADAQEGEDIDLDDPVKWYEERME
ncbi:hypothetical protein [Roseimicrobium sp. ORNL1]|uniref:hypothetical protein n=1 Tax=Roseimicrobium sp. ORNL1 TaxID=2711231 RepID=UPI0013E13B86|nr:hypothetical protein [Roseimicrobium sp. ORNL1]QIF02988.1 hypothetical protein G5S37_16150 [Roseimicrobium sp. ORNL1]